MALNEAQKQTLATALRAETNPTVVAALAIRDDVTLANWCNTKTNSDAWRVAVPAIDLFEVTDIPTYNNTGFGQGNRDAWDLMLRYAPLDISRNKMRKAITDTWGAAAAGNNTEKILQACVEKATNAEIYLGDGTIATTGTVSALKRVFVGSVDLTELSQALNKY